jgi:ferrous iron transport protein B
MSHESHSDEPTANEPAAAMTPGAALIALVGNPNVGKTTLFNRLCGERHQTSNFAGTTQEARVGDPRLSAAGGAAIAARLVDLPGAYALGLDQNESRLCRASLDGSLAVRGLPARVPDLVVLVLDATNLERNLVLAGEVLARGHRAVVALNMIDEADRRRVDIDAGRLAGHLGAAVVPTCARRGDGLDALRTAVATALAERAATGGADVAAATAETAESAGAGVVPSESRRDVGDVGEPAPRISSPRRPTAGTGLEAVRAWAAEVARDVTRLGGGGGGGGGADEGEAGSEAARAAAADDAMERAHERTDRIDAVLTHPVAGFIVFAAVMSGLFAVIFRLAAYPMEWLDAAFGTLGGWVAGVLPAGLLSQFLTDGVIAGVGATVIFLPQICLLFFLLSILEDTGYLSRAALVADRWLRPFGLSGHSFVPLLSAHACALPAIAATRGIPDVRERLATILVAPFMSCTARIPVYVLLTGLLFPDRPLAQGFAFTGCYVLGAVVAIISAIIARRTVARGSRRPLTLELPVYRVPSLRTALLTMWDRGLGFLRKAGTVILLIAMVLWWLGTFPQSGPTAGAEALRAEAAVLAPDDAEAAAALDEEADAIDAAHAASRTALGRLGSFVEPVFAPIGADRTLTVGILASFAAREVFVTTMAVQVAGREDLEDDGLLASLGTATREDGTLIFNPATAWSMLVFYVLAMQCLPTLVMTAREAGGWKWAVLQLGWMTAVAWTAALIAYRIALTVGVGGGAGGPVA